MLKKNDYNISPSRDTHTSDAEIYWRIAEIVEELKVIDAQAPNGSLCQLSAA